MFKPSRVKIFIYITELKKSALHSFMLFQSKMHYNSCVYKQLHCFGSNNIFKSSKNSKKWLYYNSMYESRPTCLSATKIPKNFSLERINISLAVFYND